MNEFIKASVIRMVRTICQTAVAMISTAVMLSVLDLKTIDTWSTLFDTTTNYIHG